MRRVWRICRIEFAVSAYAGEGGLYVAQRWNHKGHRVVYTASSLALATLEMLVHIDSDLPLPKHVAVAALLPDDLQVEILTVAELPPDWREADNPWLRDFGTSWIQSGRSAVLQVPSAVVPQEPNFLLNPQHASLARIQFEEPIPFAFDERLWKRRG